MKNYIKSTFLFLFLFGCQLIFSQRDVLTNPDDDFGTGTIYTWYFDGDGDGLGNPYNTTTTTGYLAPLNYVANNNDCNDTDASIGLPRIWYIDEDGDGYGAKPSGTGLGELTDPDELDPGSGGSNTTPTSTNTVTACSPPPGYVGNQDDCNDRNPNINIITFYMDNDGDGFGNINETTNSSIIGHCTPPYFYVTDNTDCNDNDAKINPLTVWFLDANSDGLQDVGETIFKGCIPPTSNYLIRDYDNNYNWTHDISYDINGNISNISRTYFDDLGKANVSLAKDIMRDKTWRSEVVYDNFGRSSKSSFPAVTPNTFEKIDVLSNPTARATYLEYYYGDYNTLNPFQATAAYPYTEVEYDQLNPDNVIRTYGGNPITTSGTPEWKTGYSFTVPAAQEMYYLFGYDYFNGTIESSLEKVETKFFKTITIDPHGVESVTFIDGEGKLLAQGIVDVNADTYPVISTIGKQGFVDIHIPAGINPASIVFLQGQSLYKIYNLKTGDLVSSISPGNAYRIEAVNTPLTDFDTYINLTNGAVQTNDPLALGIKYEVNYTDFSVNYYDKTGRLVKTIQPKGYDAHPIESGFVEALPVYLMATTYTYNTLGQLLESESPDEGISKFAYRNDGALRFSQNALQALQNKVSYIQYDSLGRIIENGILSGITWSTAQAAVDDTDLPSGAGITRLEQNFIVYDYNGNYQGIAPPANDFASFGLNPIAYRQNNLAGNVVATYNNETSSWYSYDLYGRVEWTVQNITGLGLKTIHYEYDAKGQVKKVIYQKDATTDKFEHFYTYNFNGEMIKVETSFNNGPLTTNADYSYNIDGSLKRTNIANGLQGLDYVYTLGGMLKSINHPSLLASNDPGGDANDVFGITLDYYEGDYNRPSHDEITTSPNAGGNTDYFNGNIKAIRYANKQLDVIGGTVKPKAFVYEYNNKNWLKNAKYGTLNATGNGSITLNANNAYHEGNINYDVNGNITSLKRTNNNGTTLDNLNYSYNNLTNQLNRVTDSAVTSADDDPNIQSQPVNNYTYNAIGQLETNAQENLTYEYNASGQVTVVKRNGDNVVQFFYNERGERFKKISHSTLYPFLETFTEYYVTDASGVTMAIYRKPAGNSIALAELPVYGADRLGVYTVGPTVATSYYQYEITDHLGNIRAVIKEPTGGSPNLIASYADYYPFGEVLPGRNAFDNYRYAFQGQELDPETGMEAFKLRLWDGRIGRWLNPDPYGQYHSPYLGMGNNPVSMIDTDGGFATGPMLFGLTHKVKGMFAGLGNKFLNFLGVTNEQIKYSEQYYLSTGERLDISSQILFNFGTIPQSYENGLNDRALSIIYFWSNKVGDGNYWGQQLNSFGNEFMDPNSVYHDHQTHIYEGLKTFTSLNMMEMSYAAGYSSPEIAMSFVPLPKISINLPKFKLQSPSKYLRSKVLNFKLHPRITNPYYSTGTATRGFGYNQYDIGHRSATFLREDIIMKGKFGIKNYKTFYFNYEVNNQIFSTAINPWRRTIFHEAPGLFK